MTNCLNKGDTHQIVSNINLLSKPEVIELAEHPYCDANLSRILWYLFSNKLKLFYSPDSNRNTDIAYDDFLPPRQVKAIISTVKVDTQYDIDAKEISYTKSLGKYIGMSFYSIESNFPFTINQVHDLVPLIANTIIKDSCNDYAIAYHYKKEADWSLMTAKRKLFYDSDDYYIDAAHVTNISEFLKNKTY